MGYCPLREGSRHFCRDKRPYVIGGHVSAFHAPLCPEKTGVAVCQVFPVCPAVLEPANYFSKIGQDVGDGRDFSSMYCVQRTTWSVMNVRMGKESECCDSSILNVHIMYAKAIADSMKSSNSQARLLRYEGGVPRPLAATARYQLGCFACRPCKRL